jgi:hypothetical protein
MISVRMICVGLTALAAAGPALAAPPAVMSEPELAAVRAGYEVAGGLNFDFGATVSTYVDGKVALQTGFTLADFSALSKQTAMGASVAAPMQILSVPGDGGVTQLLQTASPSQLTNVVLNTANNRTIRQDIAVTLVVPGLAALQSQLALQKLGSQLSQSAVASRLGR